jgi:predicted acylesterase/phospholipase RssA
MATENANSDDEDYGHPTHECDLIMKGGITSGVVFPRAITKLATKYRFFNIGGTSAGAIAAVMAAAAEFRRQSSTASDEERQLGFRQIREMPNDLKNLGRLFQPSRKLRAVFNVLLSVASAKGGTISSVLFAVFREFWLPVLGGLVPGAVVALLFAWQSDVAGVLLGVLLALLGAILVPLLLVYRVFKVHLPEHDFGFCSGLTQPGVSDAAFTDWMHERIQAISGKPLDQPLTIGELEDLKIHLVSVTTDLSSRRPYQLPIKARTHYFSRSEFATLFPKPIVSHMATEQRKMQHQAANGKEDLYRMPDWRDWPVLLVARMSLSFPLLIQAVPLYRNDYSLAQDGAKRPEICLRCLFSDGGLSSNFPIHFFDSLLPGKPTFGISLGSFDPRRKPLGERVVLPKTSREGKDTPIHPVDGIAEFAMSIVNTAKDWQDTLQSQLHGYSERIVEIRLDDSKEGGLNLSMNDETIGQLADYGRKAGTELCEFSFAEHRWRRAVTAMPAVASSLAKLADNYGKPTGPGLPDYPEIISDYEPEGLKSFADSKNKRRALAEFIEKLAALGKMLKDDPLPRASRELADLRVTASIDTNDRTI